MLAEGPEAIRLLLAEGFAPLADRLEAALDDRLDHVGLEIAEREMVLHALADCPDGDLATLRATLLEEHVARLRDGLV